MCYKASSNSKVQQKKLDSLLMVFTVRFTFKHKIKIM